MLNETKTSRRRPRPRPKIIMKKYQIMINNIRFKIVAGKINKIPEFYTIFARKMPDYIIRQRDRGQAEAKCLRPRPRPKFWSRCYFGLENLTSLENRTNSEPSGYRRIGPKSSVSPVMVWLQIRLLTIAVRMLTMNVRMFTGLERISITDNTMRTVDSYSQSRSKCYAKIVH